MLNYNSSEAEPFKIEKVVLEDGSSDFEPEEESMPATPDSLSLPVNALSLDTSSEHQQQQGVPAKDEEAMADVDKEKPASNSKQLEASPSSRKRREPPRYWRGGRLLKIGGRPPMWDESADLVHEKAEEHKPKRLKRSHSV